MYKGAQIVLNDRHSVIDCVVKDMSETGAKLQLLNPMQLPEAFELRLPRQQKTVRVRRQWVRGTLIGIKFMKDDLESL
jgi:two-component system cell cycle response regulator